MAPSRNGYGWGVFASRSFQEGDIVDVTPMFLRVDLEGNRLKVLKDTALNDYHYEYWAWDGFRARSSQYSMIAFGMTLYYNHQSTPSPANQTASNTPVKGVGPNIEQRKIGQEPDMEFPDRAVAIVYYALRDIKRGEELLVDYGGSVWFQERGIEEIVSSNTHGDTTDELLTHQESVHQQKVHDAMQQLSGKIFAGYHQQAYCWVMESVEDYSSLDSTSPYRLDTILPYLPNEKACFGSVTAMKRIERGETIEYVPALLLPSKLMHSTLLEPLVFSWDDFDALAQNSDSILPRPDWVNVQYQDDSSEYSTSSSKIRIPTEESVVFVLAGRISMMARTCDKDLGLHNAVLHVEEDPYNQDGYCVRAVASRMIERAERITLRVSRLEHNTEALIEELCLTGQPFEPSSTETL